MEVATFSPGRKVIQRAMGTGTDPALRALGGLLMLVALTGGILKTRASSASL